MKKVLASVLALTLVFGTAAAAPKGVFESVKTAAVTAHAAEETFTEGDYEYTLADDGAVLSKYVGANDPVEVVVPSEIGGKPVVELGYRLFRNKKSLKKVTVPDSVKRIGESAFDDDESLSTVVLSKNVETIDKYAFRSCTALSDITLPDSLKSIEEDAFTACASLKSIDLPDGLTKLGYTCFERSGLESIEIPASVTEVGSSSLYSGNGPFKDCDALKTVKLPQGVETLPDHLLAGITGLEKLELPNSLTAVPAEFASYCTSLKEVTIPESVTYIGEEAFKGCTSLESVDIPKTVTKLGTKCFAYSGLKSVTIRKQLTEAMTSSISTNEGPFYNCPDLTTATLEQGMTTVPARIFAGASALQYIEIPKTVTTIGGRAFNNTGLTKIEIPSSVTDIKEYAFAGCKDLSSVTLSKHLTTLGKDAFRGAAISEILIPKSLTKCSVGTIDCTGPFRDCANLKKVTFEEGTLSIANYLLSETGIEEIVIPDTVVKIDGCAFAWAEQLKKVTFGAGITEIGERAFIGCTSLKGFSIPDTVQTIGSKAFMNCTGLWEIRLPDTLTELGASAFEQSGIRRLELPSELKTVETGLCEDCKNLVGVIMPEKLEVIKGGAFRGCTSLNTVTWNDKETIKEIKGGVFADCDSLTEMTLPMGVETMGDSVFEGCDELTKAVIPDSVKDMGFYTFKECPKLTDVTLSKRTKYICKETFRYDYALKEVKIPYSVKRIDSGAFGECTALKDIYVGSNIEEIAEDAFSYFDTNVDNETVTMYGVKGTYPEDYAFAHDMNFAATPYADDTLSDYVRPAQPAEPVPSKEVKGDISGDGKLNVSDVAKLAAHIKGVKTLGDENMLAKADVNGDGKVNVTDLSRIAAAVKGIRKL